jgi:phenylacetic acid degradation operon negative regulatory protein
MGGARQDIETHVARLHTNGRLRVWSLIVTFFGDAIALRGGRVALSVLQEAMALLGIEQGAVRTALSRLAKDGWVVRDRDGRLSYYELSPQGRFAFDEATRRIYSAGPTEWRGDWTVVITDTDHSDRLREQGFVPLGGPAWLKPGMAASKLPADVLVIHGQGTAFPPGLLHLWDTDKLAAQYDAFIAGWRQFNATGLEPGQAMAARTLLIHDWRRIVLRDPNLPADLLLRNWPGTTALDLTRRLYAGLADQSERWLDAAGLPPATSAGGMAGRFNVLRNIAE